MNEIKKERNWENVLVVVVLLIILAIVTPYFVTMIHKSKVRGAYVSTEGLVSAVQNAYLKGNLRDVMHLPFEIRYNNSEYIAYTNGQKIQVEIKTNGNIPKSGSIILNDNAEVVVKDLKYGYITCNKKALDTKITCK